jgi:hypothetical protein
MLGWLRYGHFGMEELRSAVEKITQTPNFSEGSWYFPRYQRQTKEAIEPTN